MACLIHRRSCAKCGADFSSYEPTTICMACAIKNYLPEQPIMNKPHKHADVIKAWADGAIIEEFIPAGADGRTVSAWVTIQRPAFFDHIQYRVKQNKVVRWQWICKGRTHNSYGTTSRFYATKEEAQEDSSWKILEKAEWTRTEFDE